MARARAVVSHAPRGASFAGSFSRAVHRISLSALCHMCDHFGALEQLARAHDTLTSTSAGQATTSLLETTLGSIYVIICQPCGWFIDTTMTDAKSSREYPWSPVTRLFRLCLLFAPLA